MTDKISITIARWLLVATMLAAATAVVFGVGWYHAVHGAPPSLQDLSPAERQVLVSAVLDQSPGVFTPALFDPRVSYTLKTSAEIEAWDDVFQSNRLGYRTGNPAKRAGVFRVVFVGDSWTFGLGVSEAESFPKRFEELARRWSGRRGEIETWTLALPGYNTLNQTAALSDLAALLEPDAVVFCPTINDIDSSHVVLPNGSLGRGVTVYDDFGSTVPISFKNQPLDSFLFHRRWRLAMRSVSDIQGWLAGLEVPSMVFFTGKWDDRLAHSLVLAGKIVSNYVITPADLTTLEWRNPPPFYHPTPAAHDLFSKMVYQGLEGDLGWNPLPTEHRIEVPVYRGVDAEPEWTRQSTDYLRSESRRRIEADYVPSAGRAHQSGGGIDPASGELERGAVLFVRRAADSEWLKITLKQIPERSVFSPVGFKVMIPSASGGASARFVFDPRGPEEQSFTLDLPADIDVDSVMDVVLESDRAVARPNLARAASFVLVRVEQK